MQYTALAEHWLPIPGWEGHYAVSTYGRVKSVARTIVRENPGGAWRRRVIPERILKHKPSPYPSVNLSRPGRRERWSVHRAVLTAFIGPPPEGLVACHRDDVKEHNVLSNLRWDADASNKRDMLENGGNHYASKTHCPKGHPYDAENTFITKSGHRGCRICRLDGQRARRATETPEQRERRLAQMRQYQARNKDVLSARKRAAWAAKAGK